MHVVVEALALFGTMVQASRLQDLELVWSDWVKV